MEENRVVLNYIKESTLSGNFVKYIEFPVPAAFLWAKAWASNDSSATLALAGATALSVAAQVIGDSGDPRTITPASSDVVTIAANELVTVTVDYDGTDGTAAEDLEMILCFDLGIA